MNCYFISNGSIAYDFDLGFHYSCSIIMKLVCSPVSIAAGLGYAGAINTIRLPLHDIEATTLFIDEHPVDTVVNYERSEQVIQAPVPAQYDIPILFNGGIPLSLNGNIKVRIIFWRQPISPFFITLNQSN